MKVYVNFKAYRTMTLAAKYAAPYEIAGRLYGEIDGKITVEDADVFKLQKVTATSVDVKPEEFAKHVAELSKEQVEKVIGFWHSHGNMKAFHSSIDVATSDLLARQINPLITLTTNKNGEMEAIIYVYVDKLDEVFSIEADVELMMDEDNGLKKLIAKMKKKIEKKKKAKKAQGGTYVTSIWPYRRGLDEELDEELEQEWKREWRKYMEGW